MLGSLFTIILALTLLFYGSLQMQRLVVFGETVVTMSIKDSFFTPENEFPLEDTEDNLDFNLAFGLTAYDNETEIIDDARYGQLKAKYVMWGMPGVERGVVNKPLSLH